MLQILGLIGEEPENGDQEEHDGERGAHQDHVLQQADDPADEL